MRKRRARRRAVGTRAPMLVETSRMRLSLDFVRLPTKQVTGTTHQRRPDKAESFPHRTEGLRDSASVVSPIGFTTGDNTKVTFAKSQPVIFTIASIAFFLASISFIDVSFSGDLQFWSLAPLDIA